MVTGANLADAAAVHFGPAAGTVLTCTASQCTVTAPAGTGTVDVTVTTPAGTSAASAADHYTFCVPAALSG